MRVVLEQLINGLTIGSFYGLIALGYSMVYGVLKLINFAHGDFFTLGSYIGYTLLVFASGFITTRVGLWGGLMVTVAVAALCLALVGVLVERVAYRPIYPAGRLPAVVGGGGAAQIFEKMYK
jgi:branched-chain amino acid transport system permease protein